MSVDLTFLIPKLNRRKYLKELLPEVIQQCNLANKGSKFIEIE